MASWRAAAAAAVVRSCATGAHAAGVASPRSRGARALRRYGLDARRRLRQRRQFERLLRDGARQSLSGYTFYLGRRDAGGPRLGILISRRHAARAVERNRIKRCIREAFRLEQQALGAIDLLVRPPYGVRPSAAMTRQLRALLAALKR